MTFYLFCRKCKLFPMNFQIYQRGITGNTPHGDPLVPDNYEECYATLGVSSDADQESVRRAFLALAKRHHPDCATGDVVRFNAVESAYRTLQDKFSRERWGVDDGAGEYGLYYREKTQVKQFDIKHTAPQHRQYLSYDGVGAGNPRERQKQHERRRAADAAESVRQHRVERLTLTHEAGEVARVERDLKKTRTSSKLDRLVEDLIQESMSRGDFDNLSGTGKPLPRRCHDNPYVDYVTHKMNQVLIDNGFTPKWISLQKELRSDISSLRSRLSLSRSHFPPSPLREADLEAWQAAADRFSSDVLDINRKIDRFNLLVPLLVKQMTRVCLKREAERALQEGSGRVAVEVGERRVESGKEGLFGFLEAILSRR